MIMIQSLISQHKSLITNIISIIVIIIGLLVENTYKVLILNVGFFAFSGGITNWIAIYMLFDRVPLLYGSGVIPRRFNEFKQGIKDLILNEFFTKENISKFLSNQNFLPDSTQLKKHIDFEEIFNDLVNSILKSPLGNMLAMVGGKDALLPIKEPMIAQLELTIENVLNDINKLDNKNIIEQKLYSEIENIIDQRLNQLTPESVKKIIQKMIKKHLGWLVVWGGIFGGLIGLIVGLINI